MSSPRTKARSHRRLLTTLVTDEKRLRTSNLVHGSALSLGLQIEQTGNSIQNVNTPDIQEHRARMWASSQEIARGLGSDSQLSSRRVYAQHGRRTRDGELIQGVGSSQTVGVSSPRYR